MWSKPSLPKTSPCVPKTELQFLNNPDPSHNFPSTLTMESAAPTACGHITHFHAHAKLTTPSYDESFNDERASPTQKLRTILLRAMFDWLLSDWKHCEDQQKEIVFYLFPKH